MRIFFATLLLVISSAAVPLRAVPSTSALYAELEKNLSADSLRVSLLTVSPGPDAYERFGHTGIRISSRPDAMDVVYHYGVFNFRAPHFIYRFVKGETDYQLGVVPTAYFLRQQEWRGLAVLEQELALTTAQKLDLLERLIVNYRPENRTYRYNYFFDNCATRPFRLIDRVTAGTIVYREDNAPGPTLRDMVKEKTGRDTWLDFGISLVVAGRADRRTSSLERMFLPDYLSAAYGRAAIAAPDSAGTALRPLVMESRQLAAGDPAVEAAIARRHPFTSPLACFWGLFAVVALLSAWQLRRGSRFLFIDTLLLLAAGAAGVLVWFLNFCSEHPAVDGNWNCLWLWPTHLLFAVLIWIKKCKKAVDIYFFLNFAAVCVYLICAPFTGQHVNAAFLPLIFTLALRAFLLSRPLWGRLRQKR